MKIVKNNARIVCDVKGCDNFAGYKLILDSEGEENLCLCKKCLKEFYEAADAQVKKEQANENVKNKKR